VSLIFRARAEDPSLKNIAGYAAFGGVLFIVSAIILVIRSMRAAALVG
jgi:hypothetical protein